MYAIRYENHKCTVIHFHKHLGTKQQTKWFTDFVERMISIFALILCLSFSYVHISEYKALS